MRRPAGQRSRAVQPRVDAPRWADYELGPDMAEEDQPRHVIILGAGASSTSGYPLADTLRLLMSSEKAVQRELQKQGISDTDYGYVVCQWHGCKN